MRGDSGQPRRNEGEMKVYEGEAARKRLEEMTAACEARHNAGGPIRCANCGKMYFITNDWSDHTVCSRACGNAYASYLNQEIEGFRT